MSDPLAEYRQQAGPESAIPLMDDRDARVVAAAWGRIPVTWVPPATGPERPPRDQWVTFWQSCRFSMSDLARASGLSERITTDKFEMLRSLWLIYPDGTLSRWAEALIKSHVVAHIQKHTPRSSDTDA
jgi:hypothetical protein